MQHKDTVDYMKKSTVYPLKAIPCPHVCSAFSWSELERYMIVGYCKNKEGKNYQSYAALYANGEMSFTEAMSPTKFLNPFRAVDTVAQVWSLSANKYISDKAGYGHASDTKAKGVTRFTIGLFTAIPQLTSAIVRPIANLDTIPKCI